ncbi:hypothetical protein CIK98_16320 [Prevotella sp. P2-180]|nr:hypothetical protein CIK98_16320 [Prevotella sp. P2-180]
MFVYTINELLVHKAKRVNKKNNDMITTILTSVELGSKIMELNIFSQSQQAAWWLFPPIFIAILGLLSLIIFSGEKASKTFKNVKSVNMAILGPNEAGKTTLWNFFRGRPNSKVYQETDGKVELSFLASSIVWNAVKLDESDEKIRFKGFDINGNGDFIRTEWEEMIEKSNMVIFVFNAFKYLKNVDYQRDINQRMQFVYSTICKQTDGKKRGIWLLGSYADKLADKKKAWRRIIDNIKTKPYCEISHNNACLNLTNEDELKVYYKKMFNS